MEIDKNALDRYITGNWGEDCPSDEGPLQVFLRFNEDVGTFDLIDAETGEKLNEIETRNYHDLIELATASGWEVVDSSWED